MLSPSSSGGNSATQKLLSAFVYFSLVAQCFAQALQVPLHHHANLKVKWEDCGESANRTFQCELAKARQVKGHLRSSWDTRLNNRGSDGSIRRFIGQDLLNSLDQDACHQCFWYGRQAHFSQPWWPWWYVPSTLDSRLKLMLILPQVVALDFSAVEVLRSTRSSVRSFIFSALIPAA